MSIVAPAIVLVLCLLASCGAALDNGRVMLPLSHQQHEDAPLTIGKSWQVLGPFQIGTREPTWGADPLEYSGGFRTLRYNTDDEFRSSLPTNGTAKWNITEATKIETSSTFSEATLSISHPNVEWDFLKVVYGWAAVQYQSWARGELTVRGNGTQSLILYTDAILEFYVDDVHYFGGDYFTFRKAPPVLHLAPGTHTIDLRLARDVRAFGGILAPTIDVVVRAELANGTLELAKPDLLMSDVVDGKLATPVASLVLRNSGERDIRVTKIQPSDVRYPISLLESDVQKAIAPMSYLTAEQMQETSSPNVDLDIVVAAGQTRPVTFNISLPAGNVSSLHYVVTYRAVGDSHSSSLSVSQNLTTRSIYEPHRVTYLHPGGTVSYVMLRPPRNNATCSPEQDSKLPVLLALHGAGLEADNEMVTHALDAVSDLCAWVLFPTGVTPWSGDDWHNWGFTDVEAAVNSISDWLEHVDWKGQGVDLDRWIVTGHSNGGQGTWYALTHRPDKVLAAAPLSGYASIQKYVSYELWQPADPRRTAIISATLNSYRHEMLMPNARGIPLQQQHGQLDNNVPAYNSRFLAQQLFLSGTNSSYNEVTGQNHWWDTVMTTPELVDFYYTQTKSNRSLPAKLDNFDFVVGDPGDTGSKGGITVLLLEDPGQYGRLHVEGHTITTSNILSLEFDPALFPVQSLTIDGSIVAVHLRTQKRGNTNSIVMSKVDGRWSSGPILQDDGDVPHRRGRQLGSMTAILRTQGPFVIRHQDTNATKHLALQVSRNLHQYFQADANITSTTAPSATTPETGNVITLAIGDTVPPSTHDDFPIQATASAITVRDYKGHPHQYNSNDASLGAVFLRPLNDERLELVLWGSHADGLAQATRMVPALTGVGQPDFVVLGESAKWKGVDGALALGFFGHEWNVTASSIVS